MKKLLFVVGLVFAVLFSTSVFADNVAILNVTNNGIVGDASVVQGTPDSNYGGASQLVIFSVFTSNNMRAFVKFNPSLIPSGMHITSATLYLYFNDMPLDNTSGRTYDVYDTPDNTSYLDAPWWEGNQNGGDAGDVSSLMWGNQTFVYNLQSQAIVPASFDWMSWNVTEGAIDAYENNRNLSLEIRDDSEGAGSQYQSRFASKEAGSNMPYLVIHYHEAPPAPLTGAGAIISDIGSGLGNFLSAIYLPLGNLILILGIIAGVVAIFMGIAYVIRSKFR
jgi:hypothetical protein